MSGLSLYLETGIKEERNMRVVETKINGITNPMGFAYSHIKCSWKVVNTKSKYQINAKIVVSESKEFDNHCYVKEGRELNSIGEELLLKLKPMTRYYYYVEIAGENGEAARSEIGFWETGKIQEVWKADFIGTQDKDTYHPCFERKFELEQAEKISKARIYITGLGLYEAYINGEKIGNEYLAPFCNDYHQEIQYQTYDIKELLQKDNCIEIITGNGWYKGRLGYEGDAAYYGNRFGTIAELHIEYENGESFVLGTDETWMYRGSDIAMSDIYDGEEYNHLLWDKDKNVEKPVVIWEDSEAQKQKLVERYSLPVIVKEELKVKELICTPAGEKVLDFGQNFTGYVEFQNCFPCGTKIILDFGEVLQKGNFYNENYRTARAQFKYVSDGRNEQVHPHFTYYGFRYVRVTGWPGEPDPEMFIGKVVFSDLDTTVSIHTSDQKLNQLASNCIWGQKSNFLDMPTDCPQRDERLGWTGDAQVFAPTACFNMDTRAFYRKFLYNLHQDQVLHDGQIANFIPNISRLPGGSSVWGDVATFLPMTLYEYYGDKHELEMNYPLMKDWTDYIIRQDKENGDNSLWNFGFHFGDWLAQDGVTPQSMKGGTDDYFISSIYYYESVLKTAKAAGILGKADERKAYCEKAEKIYQAILDEYFSHNGRLAIDTQTAYLLCLKFNVYINKDRILEGLKLRLKKDCYKIKGGFVGATMMCQVLADNGLDDMAYYILFQEGFPGWMHCINLGATTIWERWNSILDDGSISGTGMNSLNHYAYGSVMEYVYRFIAGVQPNTPGFKSVRFVPQLNARLQSMDFSYDSVSGTYVSRWKINEDGTVTVHFEVPFACTAVAILPGTRGEEIHLEAGIYENTYKPEMDYRMLYSMDTRLEELQLDSRAMELLQSELPIAYGLIQSQDPENLSLSLLELQYMGFMGFNPQMVQHAAEKIMKLRKVWK